MSIIIPAILESTKEGFEQKLSLISRIPGVERVQVDFGDGEFITTQLLSAADMDVLNPAIIWEAHLMVRNPKDFLDYQLSGFSTIVVHYEAFENLQSLNFTLDEIKKMGFKTGVAINPTTPINILKDVEADQYLIMSVVPGKQGQSFITATIARIKELRKLIPNAIIEIDGGVNLSVVKEVSQAGADLIVAGSAIVNEGNPAENYEKLKQLVN